LAWSVSWDCNIFAWNLETLEKIKTIPNLHVDAISYLLPLKRKKPSGWQVWTGSYDRTINVLFVAEDYNQHLDELLDSEESAEIVISSPKISIAIDEDLLKSQLTLSVDSGSRTPPASKKKKRKKEVVITTNTLSQMIKELNTW